MVELRGNSVVAKSDKQSIFGFENETDEAIRVVAGDSISVDVLSEAGDKVVDSEVVGVGQEIVFTDEVVKSYWEFRSPSVLSALSDAFKTSEFYLWNIGEDKNPTKFIRSESGDGQFVMVEPEEIKAVEIVVDADGDGVPDVATDGGTTDGAKVDADATKTDSTKTEADKAVAPKIVGSAPTVVSVGAGKPDDKGVYQVSANPAVILGNPNGAVAIVVNGLQLKKFKAGDKTWSYFANIDYGYMKEGDNVYEIYGLDKDGNKTPTTTIKVFYKKAVVTPVEVKPL